MLITQRRERPRRIRRAPGVGLALLVAGCAGTDTPDGLEPNPAPGAQVAAAEPDALGGTPEGVDVATLRFGPAPLGTRAEDPLAGFPTGERQRRILCERPGKDPIRAVFCQAEAPKIGSLVELQRLLDLDFRAGGATSASDVAPYPKDGYPAGVTSAPTVPTPPLPSDGYPAGLTGGIALQTAYPSDAGTRNSPYPSGGPSTAPVRDASGRANPQFALTAHSTSLVSRLTSAINPRALIFRQNQLEHVVMGYVRGEQFVELATRDGAGRQAFFLLRFTQACNDAPAGCGPGDLYTPEAERNWTSWSLYAAEDVRNNVMDCAQCHQPGGPGTPPILRMQEQITPWTHWIRASTTGGGALLRDYRAAKGDETFAGIPGNLIDQSSPFNLQTLIATQGFGWSQPNEFSSTVIEDEVSDSAPGQPERNVPRGKSATWSALYEKNVRGETIQVPYHDVKVTDPEKLATLTRAYAAYRAGSLPRAQVPDLSQVFPSDRQTLAEIGFAPKPELDGEALVRQLCTQCHNDTLDQSLSRARFHADLSKVSREERWLAAQRVMLPEHDLRSMPPRRFRTLTDDERARIVEALAR
ncbi:MAG: hypothetical protein ABW252_15455 [Polyangiales bacterium]